MVEVITVGFESCSHPHYAIQPYSTIGEGIVGNAIPTHVFQLASWLATLAIRTSAISYYRSKNRHSVIALKMEVCQFVLPCAHKSGK